jgi:hypothetical protein
MLATTLDSTCAEAAGPTDRTACLLPGRTRLTSRRVAVDGGAADARFDKADELLGAAGRI